MSHSKLQREEMVIHPALTLRVHALLKLSVLMVNTFALTNIPAVGIRSPPKAVSLEAAEACRYILLAPK